MTEWIVYKDGEKLPDDAKIFILEYGTDDKALTILEYYANYMAGTDDIFVDEIYDEIGELILLRDNNEVQDIHTVIDEVMFKEGLSNIILEWGRAADISGITDPVRRGLGAMILLALKEGQFHD